MRYLAGSNKAQVFNPTTKQWSAPLALDAARRLENRLLYHTTSTGVQLKLVKK